MSPEEISNPLISLIYVSRDELVSRDEQCNNKHATQNIMHMYRGVAALQFTVESQHHRLTTDMTGVREPDR
jgi:hypothetical protein